MHMIGVVKGVLTSNPADPIPEEIAHVLNPIMHDRAAPLWEATYFAKTAYARPTAWGHVPKGAEPEAWRKAHTKNYWCWYITQKPEPIRPIPTEDGNCPGCGWPIDAGSPTEKCLLDEDGCLCGRQPDDCDLCKRENVDFTYNKESKMLDCDECGGANNPEPAWDQRRA